MKVWKICVWNGHVCRLKPHFKGIIGNLENIYQERWHMVNSDLALVVDFW